MITNIKQLLSLKISIENMNNDIRVLNKQYDDLRNEVKLSPYIAELYIIIYNNFGYNKFKSDALCSLCKDKGYRTDKYMSLMTYMCRLNKLGYAEVSGNNNNKEYNLINKEVNVPKEQKEEV